RLAARGLGEGVGPAARQVAAHPASAPSGPVPPHRPALPHPYPRLATQTRQLWQRPAALAGDPVAKGQNSHAGRRRAGPKREWLPPDGGRARQGDHGAQGGSFLAAGGAAVAARSRSTASRSHSLTVLSSLPEASVLPLGLNATE